MNERGKQILLGIAADIAEFKALKPGNRDGRSRALKQDAEQGIVPLDSWKWCGADSNTERKQVSRALAKLQSAGLIMRNSGFGDGLRTSFVELTKEGAAQAKQLKESQLCS